jgi:hypothetical protein
VKIIIKKSAVIMPVMLYKMIMATAVDGEGPNGLVLFAPLVSLPSVVPLWTMVMK